MKNDFPRINISSEVHRKMIAIARESREEPTMGQKILWEALREVISRTNHRDIPSPFMGEGKGGG